LAGRLSTGEEALDKARVSQTGLGGCIESSCAQRLLPPGESALGHGPQPRSHSFFIVCYVFFIEFQLVPFSAHKTGNDVKETESLAPMARRIALSTVLCTESVDI
jgi:hypothetical protein